MLERKDANLEEIWKTIEHRLINIENKPVYFINALAMLESEIRNSLKISLGRDATDAEVKQKLELYLSHKNIVLTDEQATKLISLILMSKDPRGHNLDVHTGLSRITLVAEVFAEKSQFPYGKTYETYPPGRVDQAWYKAPLKDYLSQRVTLFAEWKKESKAPFWKFWATRSEYTTSIDDAVKAYDQLIRDRTENKDYFLDKLYMIKVCAENYLQENRRGTRQPAITNLLEKVNIQIQKTNTELLEEKMAKLAGENSAIPNIQNDITDILKKLGDSIRASKTHYVENLPNISSNSSLVKFNIGETNVDETNNKIANTDKIIRSLEGNIKGLNELLKDNKNYTPEYCKELLKEIQSQINQYFNDAKTTFISAGKIPGELHQKQKEINATLDKLEDRLFLAVPHLNMM